MAQHSRGIGFWIALSLALLTAAAQGELPPEDREWRAVETPNFQLFGDAREARIKHIGDSLERLKSILDHLGTRGATPPVPTFVYVFRDQESFAPYGPLDTDGRPKEKIAGFFHKKPHGNFLAVHALNRSQSTRTVLHELVHFFVRYNLPGAPLWFNEGLAEFYSTFEVVDPYIHTGKIIDYHLYWLQQNDMLPLTEVFAVNHNSPAYNETDRRGVFYAQSWLLVHYLLLGTDDGLSQVLHFLELQRHLPTEEAFVRAFKTTPEKLQKKLRRYQKSSRFTFRRAKVDVDDLKSSFRTRTLSRAETLARLGELRAGLRNRTPLVEEHLQASLELDPSQVRAYIGLGQQALMKMPEGPDPDYDMAVQHFATAKSLAPDDKLLDFLLLHARNLRGDPPSSMKRAAVRLVNANPGLAGAWYLLTQAYEDSTVADLDNKIRAYEGAFRLMPDELEYAQTLVVLYRRAGRDEDAQRLVDRVLKPRGLAEKDEPEPASEEPST